MLAAFIVIPLWLIAVTESPFAGLGATTPGFWNPFTDRQDSPITVVSCYPPLAGAWATWVRSGWCSGSWPLKAKRKIPACPQYRHGLDVGAVLVRTVARHGGAVGAGPKPVAWTKCWRIRSASSGGNADVLHPIVAGLLLSAVIAAVMSTADSQLLLASAIATDDLPVLRRYAYSLDAGRRVWLGRALLVLTGIVAMALSIFSEESVFALVSYAWGGMGAAFAPVTVLALYWRRFNTAGALAAMLAGTAAATIWALFLRWPGRHHGHAAGRSWLPRRRAGWRCGCQGNGAAVRRRHGAVRRGGKTRPLTVCTIETPFGSGHVPR